MKRFYKQVSVEEGDDGFALALDGRPVRTPRHAALSLKSAPLAEAIAEEWRGQGEEVVPQSMPLTRIANTALDLVAREREAVVRNLAGYGSSDLVCYWADSPEELVLRQVRAWQPLLQWAEAELGAPLQTTAGVGFVEQVPESLARLHAQVAAHDDMELAALNDLITITGSLLIGLAASAGRLDAEAAWAAARLDETYQAERWGIDQEAAARADTLRADFGHALRFLALHRNR